LSDAKYNTFVYERASSVPSTNLLYIQDTPVKKAGALNSTESVLHYGLRVSVISYYVGTNHLKLEEMGRMRGGGGICIKFNFPRSINFSITRLKLKSTTLPDELKLTMFITILKRRKYEG
jgi:hypothetical protein